MEGEEQDVLGYSYRGKILQKWLEIVEMGELVRKFYILDKKDKELLAEYIAKLATLWKEVYPKVEGRSELHELEQEFNRFSELVNNPIDLLEEENSGTIQELETIIRKVLDKLDMLPMESE